MKTEQHNCVNCKHAHLESWYMVCDIDGVVNKCVENCDKWVLESEEV